MADVRIVHYKHRYEADMARGFLDDAGIPCSLASDSAAGGVSYIGGLAGAWVIVGDADAEAAVEVLEDAGMRGPEQPSGPAADLALRADTLPPVERSEAEDLTEALEAAQKAEFKYFVRCVLGVSPAALIPLVGLAAQGEIALIALLTFLVVFTEGWKAVKSSREVKRLERALAKLEEETRE